jgi:hypothetical protein
VRLRLYRIGGAASQGNQHCPLLIDRFPFSLCDPAEWSLPATGLNGFHECCEIELIEDTLYVTDRSFDESTRLNGQPFSVSSLLPGDRLTINAAEFLVSYERMTSAPPPPMETVFPNANRVSQAHCSGDKSSRSGADIKLPQLILSRTLKPPVLV